MGAEGSKERRKVPARSSGSRKSSRRVTSIIRGPAAPLAFLPEESAPSDPQRGDSVHAAADASAVDHGGAAGGSGGAHISGTGERGGRRLERTGTAGSRVRAVEGRRGSLMERSQPLVSGDPAAAEAHLSQFGASRALDTDEQGRTALHHVCAQPRTRHTERLVISLAGSQAGRLVIDAEDTSRGNGGGRTPLGLACLAGNVDAVHALVTLGAGIGVADTEALTPLHHAARGGHAACALVLLEAALRAAAPAAEDGDGDRRPFQGPVAVEVFRKKWVDPRDGAGRTPLHWAAIHGHVAFVHLLAEWGADVGARDDGGWAPAHRAALNNQKEAVETLFEWGHAPFDTARDGKCILDYSSAQLWVRPVCRRAAVRRRRRRRALALGLMGMGFDSRELEDCWPADEGDMMGTSSSVLRMSVGGARVRGSAPPGRGSAASFATRASLQSGAGDRPYLNHSQPRSRGGQDPQGDRASRRDLSLRHALVARARESAVPDAGPAATGAGAGRTALGGVGRVSRVSVSSGDREVWFDAESWGDAYLGRVRVLAADGEYVETTGATLRHSLVFGHMLEGVGGGDLRDPTADGAEGEAIPELEMTSFTADELARTFALMDTVAEALAEVAGSDAACAAAASAAAAGAAAGAGAGAVADCDEEAAIVRVEAAHRALGAIDNWDDLVGIVRAASFLDARDLIEAVRDRMAAATATLHGISTRLEPGWIPRSTADSILLAFGADRAFTLEDELHLMDRNVFLRDPDMIRLLQIHGVPREDVPEEYEHLFPKA